MPVISEADDGGSDSDASSLGGEREGAITSAEEGPLGLGLGERRSLEGNRIVDHEAVKSGYLMKKGERRSAWRKRWFVLRGGQVAMYKNDKVSYRHLSTLSPILCVR